ncbi:MAG: hypothetical protein J6A69_03475 [Clostridia bacterium]|nr:hypothetical protein [Clostridia bacterium]
MNLTQSVEKLIKIARSSGCDAYAVGGCVRDSLMGLTPKDWDITINCPPEKTKEIFKDFKTFDTGIKYGTVSVIIDDEIFEVTTFRAEKEYKDFRHPDELTFSDDINEDLRRRDFTVNAMAYNPSKGIVDLFGGQNDLENKILRCVRNPKERFFEDPLRILRGVRFACTYGFETEKATKEAIFELMGLIKHVSKERVKAEFDKMFLNSKKVSDYLSEYEEVVKISLETDNIDVAKKYIDNTDNLSVKWALILLNSDITKLKLSNQLKKECSILKAFTDRDIKQDLISVKYLVKEYGFEMSKKIAEFKRSMGEDVTKITDNLEKIKNEKLCCTLKELAVNGRDLIDYKIEEKEKFKEILDFLLNLVIEEKCENKKEELIKKIII